MNLTNLPEDIILIIDHFAINPNLRLTCNYFQNILPNDEFHYTTELNYNNNYKDTLHLYKNLQVLYCSYTQIQEIPKELTNLQILYCYNTQIQEIPKELTNCKVYR